MVNESRQAAGMLGGRTAAQTRAERLADEGLLSSYDVCMRAGISYRMLDYWARSGIVVPALPARTSGTPRGWTDEQALAIAVGARARDAGLPLGDVTQIIDVILNGGPLGAVVRWPLTDHVTVEIDTSDLQPATVREAVA